ncbi:MAG: hypothetical protein ACYSOI_08785 [Planctomycetota bacterium]|jgi:hypothetical protein
MNNEHNILDQAAKAFSEGAIPKGPSDDRSKKNSQPFRLWKGYIK